MCIRDRFSITRQAIINDDLNMLTDVPMKLGRAAKSTIADLVYAILTSNPKISTDNVSLFDKAKHANVLESAAMDVASLEMCIRDRATTACLSAIKSAKVCFGRFV